MKNSEPVKNGGLAKPRGNRPEFGLGRQSCDKYVEKIPVSSHKHKNIDKTTILAKL